MEGSLARTEEMTEESDVISKELFIPIPCHVM